MTDFAEKFRQINELAYRSQGYSDAKAVIIEGEVDYDSNPTVKEYIEKGYRIIDENRFGMGLQSQGTIVVFVKNQEK